MNFNSEIQKLLSLKTSGLENQFKISLLLQEIQNIISQNGENLDNPVAYFAILMSLLSKDQDDNSESLIYIMDKVLPLIPENILILKFDSISSLLLSFLDLTSMGDRAIIGCLESLLLKMDSKDLHFKEKLKIVMGLVTDSRPKVRKRAVEAISILFEKDSTLILNYSIQILKKAESIEKLHVILQFLKSISHNMSTKGKVMELVQEIIQLPKKYVGSMITGKMVFEILQEIIHGIKLFELIQGIQEDVDLQVIYSITRDVLDIKPFYNDLTLVPGWLELVGNSFIKYSELLRLCEENVANDYLKVLSQLLSKFFIQTFNTAFDSKNETKNIIKETSASILGNLLIYCVPTGMVEDAKHGLKNSDLEVMIKTVGTSLSLVHYRESWGYILTIYQAIFVRLGSEASELCQGLLPVLFAFRDDKNYLKEFPFKEQLEACMISSVQMMGIDKVLSVIPLNIEQELPGEPTRPYFLATLEKALKGSFIESPWAPFSFFGPHTLKFYHENLFQLSQRLFERAESLSLAGKDLDAKLYETLGHQAMNLLPLISKTRPIDVEVGLERLVPTLGYILQSEPKLFYPNLPSRPDFRPVTCDTLQKLIRGYVELVEELGDEESEELNHAANGILKVKEYTNQFLSTLCNLYTTVPAEFLESSTKGVTLQTLHERQSQYVEKTIAAFLSIAEKSDVKSYFISMMDDLKDGQNIPGTSESSVEGKLKNLRSYAILDLLLLLLDSLPSDDLGSLESYYQLLISLLGSKDSTTQKKAYKSLFVALNYIPLNRATLNDLSLKLLDTDIFANVTSGSKKARILCLARLTEKVPDEESDWLLKWIPMCLSEVMLATKEASEKARHAAYECLLAMGRQMKDIDANSLSKEPSGLVDELDDDDNMETSNLGMSSKNGITEFFMMVSAGLAGTTPHFQSAAIGSLSRLFFEFHEFLEAEFIDNIVHAICSMLTNKSREVLKSLLGFIKVLIAAVSPSTLKLFLKDIVFGIMGHSKSEKSHFKSKIRHILERLVRKFSYSELEELIPESDQKLISNIKKRKERSRKRKLEKSVSFTGVDGSDQETKPKSSSNKNFEEAMYNSDSEIESENDDNYIPDQFKDETKSKTTTLATLCEDQDQVLDFLDSSKLTSQVSSISLKSRKRRREEDFKTDEYGRLYLEEPETIEEQVADEDYYKQTLTGEGSFLRTPSGHIKFLKENKRAKTQELVKSGSDWRRKNHNKKDMIHSSKKLGEKYASKKAGGDVKRKGKADPHAYIPLSGKMVGNRKKSTVFKNEFKKLLNHKSKK